MWLISCKVLPANHRVTADAAQVFDLAQTLRDGVLLCQLLNNLRPHTINLKEINLRPQMSQVEQPLPTVLFNRVLTLNAKENRKSAVKMLAIDSIGGFKRTRRQNLGEFVFQNIKPLLYSKCNENVKVLYISTSPFIYYLKTGVNP